MWGIIICDNVCQWLATGRLFSLGTPFSSTNKTDHHDITEILLEVALNTINHNHNHLFYKYLSFKDILAGTHLKLVVEIYSIWSTCIYLFICLLLVLIKKMRLKDSTSLMPEVIVLFELSFFPPYHGSINAYKFRIQDSDPKINSCS
jgi:hypothetical protein